MSMSFAAESERSTLAPVLMLIAVAPQSLEIHRAVVRELQRRGIGTGPTISPSPILPLLPKP